MADKINVLLVGNQNCGKTTLFNALTGSHQYVGNWPGVTVDKVVGFIKGHHIKIIDLPGLYSLSPYSPEEVVSRNTILSKKTEDSVILNVLDASHIERSLSLTFELLSFNKKMVIALNMIDAAKANHIVIDVKALEARLGCTVIPISAANKKNLDQLIEAIKNAQKPQFKSIYPLDLNNKIQDIAIMLKDRETQSHKEFVALSLLQNDHLYLHDYDSDTNLLAKIYKAQKEIEEQYKLDAEQLIATVRYEAIEETVKNVVKKETKVKNSISEKIDKIVTNKYLSLPIFFLIVYVVYFFAVSTIGTWATDYANDVVFGEWATNGANYVLASISAPSWLSSLVVDGIIGGVGAVLGFLPQMVVLFFLLSFLEQCGYMSRVAFILDQIFRHFGLSGRSLIPMVISSGCAVPAIMSTKSIDNINERRLTVMTSHFVPCSAKLPIIAMIAAAFVPGSTFIAPAVYFMTLVSILVTALILKKLSAFNEEVSPFVLELPDYHLPKFKNILRTTLNRCKSFVVKAGTIIFSTVVVIWFLSNFNFTQDGFGMVDVSNSMLAAIGSTIAFIFIPLGFYSWEATVAIFTGLLAKENVVGTLAVLLGLQENGDDYSGFSQILNEVFPTTSAILAFLAFNLFSTPCVAALGAMRRELASQKIFLFTIVYLICWAYGLSLCIYQIGGLILGDLTCDTWTVVAFMLIFVLLFFLIRPERKNKTFRQINVKMV